MLKENEYRKHAAQTVDLAHRAATTADKGRLLALAEAWLDLADRAHRVAARHARKARHELHPLLREGMMGDPQQPE
jgi:hypothetical protein